jgi:hypothetical protein
LESFSYPGIGSFSSEYKDFIMHRHVWWIGILTGLAATTPGLVTTLVFGMPSKAFPWFLAFPAEGFGWPSHRAPKESHLTRNRLWNHL